MCKYLVVLVAIVALTQGATLLKNHALASLNSRLDGRIVNGTETNITTHPHQASLQLSGLHICGASIISNFFLITAAHCVTFPSAVLTVRVGSSFHGSGGTRHQVLLTDSHPLYVPTRSDYDCALIRTLTPIVFGIGVQPIPLTTIEPTEGENATVTGWGTTSSGGDLPDVLMAVQVPIISRPTCQAMYEDEGYTITDRMICAGYTEGGRDSCQGDSGGPLIINGTLVGCVSWGLGCAEANHPGVYANVADFRSWITTVTGI